MDNNNLVSIHDGKVTVSSLAIAEHFKKAHRSVLNKIKYLECSEEFGRHNFVQSSYKNAQNKEQPYYCITRDGFMFLVMGFTGKEAAMWKERFINAFNAMEEKLRGSIRPIQLSFNPLDRQQVADARQALNVFAEKGCPLESITKAEVAGYIASVMNRTTFELHIDSQGGICLRPAESPYKGLAKAIADPDNTGLKDEVIEEIAQACVKALAHRARQRKSWGRALDSKLKVLDPKHKQTLFI